MNTIPIEMIVAYTHNRVIGKDNSIPWHIPSDLKRFKQITEDNIVIMGRKTWESLPKKPLPNRINIVITKDTSYKIDDPNVIIINHLDDLAPLLSQFELDEQHKGKTAYVIGGASLYEALMSSVNKIHATEINTDIEGDTYFPILSDRLWKVSHRTEQLHMGTITYEYVTYERY